jgi:hypothetical protein
VLESECYVKDKSYLVLLLLFLVDDCLLSFFLLHLFPQFLQSLLLFFFCKRCDLFSRLAEILVGSSMCISNRIAPPNRAIGTYVFSAWNSACAVLRNFFPQSSQTSEFATSPSLSAAGSMVGSVSSAFAAGARRLSMSLSWLASSQSIAPWTISTVRSSNITCDFGRLTSSGLLNGQFCSFFLKPHAEELFQVGRCHIFEYY